MAAARFATTVEADAPALPTPATEYTFRPMGRLPTDSDRLERWRRTVERVAPAAPTDEDVKATVAALEGVEPAGPRTRAGKAPRGAEPETDPVAMLVRGIAGVLREAEGHDDILGWIGCGLLAGGLPRTWRPAGESSAIRRGVPGGARPFALAMMCGDPTAMTTRQREPEEVPTPQATHGREPSQEQGREQGQEQKEEGGGRRGRSGHAAGGEGREEVREETRATHGREREPGRGSAPPASSLGAGEGVRASGRRCRRRGGHRPRGGRQGRGRGGAECARVREAVTLLCRMDVRPRDAVPAQGGWGRARPVGNPGDSRP